MQRLLLIGPLAFALGACTMVQADPRDRTVIEPTPSARPVIPRAAATQPPEDPSWHLRLTRL